MLRSHAITRLATASALLLLGTTACVLDDVAIEEADTFICTTDEDCVGDYLCINGTCQLAIFQCIDGDGDQWSAGPDCEGDPSMLDCDDSDNMTFPGATEICDGKDNDCDGDTDEELAAVACPLTEGVCATAMTTCVDGAPQDCGAGCPGADCLYGADYVVDEGTDESSDGIDNDCDGQIDENKPSCVDGEACGNGCLGGLPEAQCACKMGTRACNPDGTNQCLDSSMLPVIFPFAQNEICNNTIDDNCDGVVDEMPCDS